LPRLTSTRFRDSLWFQTNTALETLFIDDFFYGWRGIDRFGGPTVSIARFPELHGDGSPRRARSDTPAIRERARRMSNGMDAALDVARTLLILVFIGIGVVVLQFLLVLARSAIGQ
jgi:hypothetical protein